MTRHTPRCLLALAGALLPIAFAAPAMAAPPPTVLMPNITVAEPDEGSNLVAINVALDRPNPSASAVSALIHDFTTTPLPGSTSTYGTATPDVDYTVRTRKLVWQPGQQITTFTVSVHGDGEIEPQESIDMRIDSAYGVTIDDNDLDLDLVNADTLPTIALPNAEINEPDAGCVPYTVALHLSRPAPSPASVLIYDFSPVPVPGSNPPRTYGTATDGEDYETFPPFTLQFPTGATTATFPVNICGDERREENEEIDIRVMAPQGLQIGDNDLDLVLRNDD